MNNLTQAQMNRVYELRRVNAARRIRKAFYVNRYRLRDFVDYRRSKRLQDYRNRFRTFTHAPSGFIFHTYKNPEHDPTHKSYLPKKRK